MEPRFEEPSPLSLELAAAGRPRLNQDDEPVCSLSQSQGTDVGGVFVVGVRLKRRAPAAPTAAPVQNPGLQPWLWGVSDVLFE